LSGDRGGLGSQEVLGKVGRKVYEQPQRRTVRLKCSPEASAVTKLPTMRAEAVQ